MRAACQRTTGSTPVGYCFIDDFPQDLQRICRHKRSQDLNTVLKVDKRHIGNHCDYKYEKREKGQEQKKGYLCPRRRYVIIYKSDIYVFEEFPRLHLLHNISSKIRIVAARRINFWYAPEWKVRVSGQAGDSGERMPGHVCNDPGDSAFLRIRCQGRGS